MVEIKVMLLSETWDKSILDDTTKYFQEKFNGVRALVHIKGGKVVGIRNRSNNPILYCFPEFKDLKFDFDTGILDCEIVVFKDGRSTFYGGVDKRRSSPTDSVLKNYPATMVVFDALKIDSDVLIMKPYSYRYLEIGRKIGTQQNKLLKFALNYEGRDLWDRVKKENLEGVVIKNPNTTYEIGKRSKDQIKMKNYKVCEVLVQKGEPNSKGLKISGHTKINGEEIEVEAQIPGIFNLPEGSTQNIKYLDIYNKKLIQPTVCKYEQCEG